MAWTTPKTDWMPADYFDVAVDWTRIQGNYLEIERLINILFGYPAFLPLNNYWYDGVGMQDFYNNIEVNIKIIVDYLKIHGIVVRIQPTKTWKENGPAWGYADLNRIEETPAIFRAPLLRMLNGRYNIEFTLNEGGPYFGY